MSNLIGSNHVELFHRNNAFDSHDSNTSVDANKYVIAAIRKTKIGAADQLYIYS